MTCTIGSRISVSCWCLGPGAALRVLAVDGREPVRPARRLHRHAVPAEPRRARPHGAHVDEALRHRTPEQLIPGGVSTMRHPVEWDSRRTGKAWCQKRIVLYVALWFPGVSSRAAISVSLIGMLMPRGNTEHWGSYGVSRTPS